MLSKYLPEGWQKNNSELTITAPNGSKIYFLGADNPDSMRGPNPYGVIFDEFDDIKIDVWEQVVRPVLAMNGGWAWFVGTPKGQGNLFKFFHKQEKDWASFMLKASDSGLFKQEELDAAKKELPQAIYNQEFECEFITGGSTVFRNVASQMTQTPWRVEEERKYRLGVDLAKLNDWTVITPIDRHSWQVGTIDRFNQVDYPMIESRIEAAYYRYNKAPLTIDATGIGEVVCDHLEKRGIPIERVVFTEASRMQLLENLSIMLEKQEIWLPSDEQLKLELNAMRYELGGERKKLKIVSPIHDDCVFSLSLAVKDLGFKLQLPQNMAMYQPKFHERQKAKFSPF